MSQVQRKKGILAPIMGRTRRGTGHGDAERGEALQAPLQQAIGNHGRVTVKVLFSVTDLRSWKELAGTSKEDLEKNHPEWQRDCGINIPPQDPLVLSLEKEKRSEKKEQEKIRRCCSACSIGQRCLKTVNPKKKHELGGFNQTPRIRVLRCSSAPLASMGLCPDVE